ncbi:MAG TPA: hypothetical protein VH120_02055 [Gemmataceae bacterium]|jgi:hypothetical protein|nr:hypothetical protein [Gemmataceae bacterium]
MNPDPLPEYPWQPRSPSRGPTWRFAAILAALAFVLAGSVVFYGGYRQSHPPPPPPGTAYCGNEVLGGWFVMIVGGPIAGAMAALLGGLVGAAADYCLDEFTRTGSR